MATTRKKLHQILKQTRVNGQDIGKMRLLNFVNSVKGLETLKPEEIRAMEQFIENKPEQMKVVEYYEGMKQYLTALYNVATANVQMFFSAYRELLRQYEILKSFNTAVRAVCLTPYCCTKKQLAKLEAEAQEYIDDKEYKATDLIIDIVQRWIIKKKNVPAEAKAIFDALDHVQASNRKVCSKYEFLFNDIQEYINYGTYKGVSDDTKNYRKLVDLARKEYIENELSETDSQFFDDVSKATLQTNTSDMETVETYYRYYLYYNGRIKDPYSDYSGIMDVVLESKTVNKNVPSKFELLKADLEFDADNSCYRENPAEFMADYKELFDFAKDELAKRRPAIKNILDNTTDIMSLAFTGRQLELKANAKRIAECFSEKEPLNLAEYIRQQQFQECGHAVAQTKRFIAAEGGYTRLLLNLLGGLSKMSKTSEYTKPLYSQIEKALTYVSSYDAAIEVYSDLLRIDLTPLKTDPIIRSCCIGLNIDLYRHYSMVLGDKATVASRQAKIKELFQPIDYRKFDIQPERMEAVYREFEALRKQDTFAFLARLMSGAVMKLFCAEIEFC